MQKEITENHVKLHIDCNEVINLFLHTLNIYGLLGNHGMNYALRRDINVIRSIDKEIEGNVKQGDHYFSYGKLNIYETGMNYILDNNIWKQSINEINVHFGITEMNFNEAFKKSWSEFFRDYWNDTLIYREKTFKECINAFDFIGSLKKMMNATHSEMTRDFYIFPAEALEGSGLKFKDNICMGGLTVGEDFGFVHEGLHLLLREEWAKNNEIVNILNSSNKKDYFYNSWISKYEQVLVVGLDCCIKSYDDEAVKKYFQGCCIDDMYNVSYPLIKDYYYNGCSGSIVNLMKNIISSTL